MEGMIFDIKRFALHDGPGVRTTVFLKGCPLSCQWCHNPEGMDPEPSTVYKEYHIDGKVFKQKETVGKLISTEELIETFKKDRLVMDESGGGVTFSGGEPTRQSEFLLELLQACKEEGFHTAVDTSAFCKTEDFVKIATASDLLLFDFKHSDPKKHQEYTGVSNDLIKLNLQKVNSLGVNIKIRIPLIPGFNMTLNEMTDIMLDIKQLATNIHSVDLLPYHYLAGDKYKRMKLDYKMENTKSINEQDVAAVKELFEDAGFQVHVGG